MQKYDNAYEDRFHYIGDENLRKHMADALEFVSRLLTLSSLPLYGENKNYVYKTCVLYTASLIESHLNFFLLQLGFQEIQAKDWDYSHVRGAKILDVDGNEVEIITAKRTRKNLSLHGEVDFNALIDFAHKNKVIDTKLSEEIHKIRKLRNTIHLMKLSDIDRTMKKETLDKTFETAGVLFKMVEEKLKKL